MPECILSFVKNNQDFILMDHNIISNIIQSYFNDMGKYTSQKNESLRISRIYQNIPSQLAKENQKFQYKVISRGATSSLFGPAILWLKNSGIVNQVFKTESQLPLEMYKDLSAFKLYMTDVGLFVNKARYPLYQIDLSKQPTMISMGPLTEHYVANELRINGYETYYWESNGIAEVDFLIQKEANIIPIEVKSNIHTKSRSLNLYMKKYNPAYAIRISEKNFGYENNIKSVPLYATFCI